MYINENISYVKSLQIAFLLYIEACKFSLIMEGILQLMEALHAPYKTRKKEVDN